MGIIDGILDNVKESKQKQHRKQDMLELVSMQELKKMLDFYGVSYPTIGSDNIFYSSKVVTRENFEQTAIKNLTENQIREFLKKKK